MTYRDIVAFWKQQKVSTAAELSALLDSYSVNFAYHSGKIENEQVTYHDTREIFKNDGVSNYTGDLRTLFEIRNAKSAYELILDAFELRQPITEDFVKQIQKALTINTYDTRRYQRGERPGQYKLGDYVTGKKEVGALAEDVPDEMQELLEEISEISNENALIAAAYFHAKFENIHPFSDGNGRTGRLLMNYFLLLHDHPPVVIHEESRKEYYAALEEYDENIELDALVKFLSSQLCKTWENFLDRSARSSRETPALSEILHSTKDRLAAAQEEANRRNEARQDTSHKPDHSHSEH